MRPVSHKADDAVVGETEARRATSVMVGLRLTNADRLAALLPLLSAIQHSSARCTLAVSLRLLALLGGKVMIAR